MSLPLKLKLLLMIEGLVRPDVATTTPEKSRKKFKHGLKQLGWIIQYSPETLYSVKDEWIPVTEDGKIRLRIFRPLETSSLPVIVYFHGGGFVQGDIDTHDATCRRLAKHNQCVVVSVDYRLAPEFPYPIPGEDCYAATLWVVAHAKSFGGNPDRVVVMGDSAGGNLATVVCMMARDQTGPALAGQLLIYPALDATLSMPSINTYGTGYFLTKELIAWYVNHYCGKTENKRLPYLSPIFAENLRQLPPTVIVTAEFDPLKDEGELYATRLREAGNAVHYTEYKRMIHGFLSMPKLLRETRDLELQISLTLNQFFGRT
jgi:acetyl esterase